MSNSLQLAPNLIGDRKPANPKALELKRRIEERRAVAEAARVEESTRTLRAKRRLKEIGQANSRTATHLSHSTDGNLRLFERAEQQFSIDEALSSLSKDLNRGAQGTREHGDRLSSLETRIRRLQRSVSSGVQTNTQFADQQIANELRQLARPSSRGGASSSTTPSAVRFVACGKCGAETLAALLEAHESMCIGAPDDFNTNDDDAADAKTPTADMRQCPICGRKVAESRLERHTKQCADKATFKSTKSVTSELAMTTPQKPMKLLATAFGPTWIKLDWKPPILDGGAPIFEYELLYSITFQKRVGKKIVRKSEEQPALTTSRYTDKSPIGTFGFTMYGLIGGTEYSNIRVRCKNKKGWSPESDTIEVAKTLDIVPPSVPLYLEAGEPSSTSISLRWGAPFNDGGSDIEDYEIQYTYETEKEDIASSSSKGKPAKGLGTATEEKTVCFKVGSVETEYTLIDLKGDVEYRRIQVTAISAAALRSRAALIPVVKTKQPSMREMLQKELQRAKAAKGEFIDTDFYTAFVQREQRLDYIARLTGDVKALDDAGLGDDAPKESKKKKNKWGKLKLGTRAANSMGRRKSATPDWGDETADDAAYEALVPGYARRKLQYNFRINRLDELILQCDETKLQCVAGRSQLSQNMADVQRRLLQVRAEQDRVATFKGKTINSSVIHGSSQQYTVGQLDKDLTEAMEKCLSKIAWSKSEVIRLDKLRMKVIKDKVNCQDALKERVAAYNAFTNEAKKARKFSRRLQSKGKVEVLYSQFAVWKDFTVERVRVRALMTTIFGAVESRQVASALYRWRHGKHRHAAENQSAYVLESRGATLLLQAEAQRRINEKGLQAVLSSLAGVGTAIKLSQFTNSQAKTLRANSEFENTEYALPAGTKTTDLPLMLQGDGLVRMGEHEKAVVAYQAQITELRNAGGPQSEQLDIVALSRTYGGLANAQFELAHMDRAILSYDRQLSLAKEVESRPMMAAGTLGLARGQLAKHKYEESADLFESAMLQFSELGDRQRQAQAYRGMQEAFVRLNNTVYEKRCKDKADAIENELQVHIAQRIKMLADFRYRLINQTAENSHTVPLERVSAAAVRMRKLRIERAKRIEDMGEDTVTQGATVEKVAKLLDRIRKQLQEAKVTDKDELTSNLVDGKDGVFEIEELKVRLAEREIEVAAQFKQENGMLKNINTRVANSAEEIQTLTDELSVEEGALMRSVIGKRVFRQIALNPANAAGNEVTGTATGGIELVVSSEGSNINVFDIHKGTLLAVHSGDEEGRHVGEAEGHTSVITCLFFYDERVYSGSLDTTIMVWDVGHHVQKRLFTCHGHESTVCCVAADAYKICSGSADTKVHIWDKDTGALLRLLHGHAKSVTALQVGPTFMVSGDACGDVRVWKVTTAVTKHRPYMGDQVKSRAQLRGGHKCPVTCVSYGNLEVITGGADGVILVWWLKSLTVLQRCSVHTGPIRQIQFDATRIVSCSDDKNVCVTDITTGESVQSLRGHTAPVLGVMFDTDKILSVSSDNTLRHWEWGTVGETRLEDKHHIFDTGDTLNKIATKYSVRVADLIKWNAIVSVRAVYGGQRLIVHKGNPDEPTAAEREFEEQKRKKDAKLKKVAGGRKSDKDMGNPKSLNDLEEMRDMTILKETKMKDLKDFGYDPYTERSSTTSRIALAQSKTSEDRDMQISQRERVNAYVNEFSLTSRLGKGMAGMKAAPTQVDREETEAEMIDRKFAEENKKNDEGDLSDWLLKLLVTRLVAEETKDLVSDLKHGSAWYESTAGRLACSVEDTSADRYSLPTIVRGQRGVDGRGDFEEEGPGLKGLLEEGRLGTPDVSRPVSERRKRYREGKLRVNFQS